MEDGKAIWEILVPTVRNDGRPFRLRFHRVFDEKVKEISGGLTVSAKTKGHWLSPDGELFVEHMIPVKLICTKEQIEAIVDFALVYYEQKAILAYKISDDFILKHKD